VDHHLAGDGRSGRRLPAARATVLRALLHALRLDELLPGDDVRKRDSELQQGSAFPG
jgi:hypothetical protein